MPIPSSSLSPPAKRASRPLRPKGLWRARATLSAPRCIAPERKASSDTSDSDHDDEFESVSSLSSVASRAVSDFGSELSDDDVYRWDFARRQTCGIFHTHLPGREQNWIRRQRIMDSTSVAFVGTQTEMKTSCDLEDWMDLKDLFAKAAEQYETGSPAEALPLLRGVVHECHTFLKFYQDPSVLFAGPRPASDPSAKTAEKHQCRCVELPTAFHAILGFALFLFGNLIDQDGSLAMSGEPNSPIPYWLAALDVFETGENLPSRVYGTGCDSPEDWRMAIVWGRTLVAIADATISQALGDPNCVATFAADDPSWPADSPFAAIALRRPPLTRRMTLSTASPNDLMNLAMDQFSRGIFHMPHPQHALHVSRIFIESPAPQPSCHTTGATTVGPSPSPHLIPAKATAEPFSRPKELFTIASEVMLLAEKLPHASERQFWASWADSVLNQMKMEADMDAWRGIISRTRGKCWLIAGSVHADELEDRLSQGDDSVLDTANAAEARAFLEKAVAFLEKGKAGSDQIEEEEERQKMLAEALYTLGNFTKDKAAQEALFARAEAVSDDPMDVDS